MRVYIYTYTYASMQKMYICMSTNFWESIHIIIQSLVLPIPSKHLWMYDVSLKYDESQWWTYILYMHIDWYSYKHCSLEKKYSKQTNQSREHGVCYLGLKMMYPVSYHLDVQKTVNRAGEFLWCQQLLQNLPPHDKSWQHQTCMLAKLLAPSHQVLLMLWQR